MSSLEGHALVASPYLHDPNFSRSVVFIVRHNSDGAYGVIINRASQITVGELLGHVLEREFDNASLIHTGGPVDGPLAVLHEREDQADMVCSLGIYLTTEQKKLTEICEHPVGNYRVFDGYSGWGPNQLEDELKQGGWLVWQPTREEIFSPSDEIWQNALRQIGRGIISHGIDPIRIPEDPSAN